MAALAHEPFVRASEDVRAALERLSPGTYKDTRIERHLAHFAPTGEDVEDHGGPGVARGAGTAAAGGM